MSRARASTMPTLGLALLVVATFLLAEITRAPDPRPATALSMVGWAGFVALLASWLWQDCGLRAGVARLARILVLAALAGAVLYLYYRRARLLDAGVEVDATYTFIGLEWFTALGNPVTFAGHTVSYAQMALQLLGHLPGWLLGFDRLGPFAIHVAILLQLAVLLAVLTAFVVEGSLAVQALTVVGLAAVFSNRLTVLLCNLTGYAIPSVAVGVMFLWTALTEAPFAVMAPRIGALLALSLLQHYPGFFFVLPLVALWVVAGSGVRKRLATFVRTNVPLWTVLAMAATSAWLHPEMLLPRLRDVTAPTLRPEDLWTKASAHWAYLVEVFPGVARRTFFVESAGSWHLVNLPPLGGLVVPIAIGNWIATVVGVRRRLAYVLRLAAFAACLLALTVLQHLVTGFEDYRDMVLIVGLWTSSLGFVLLATRERGLLRVATVAWVVAVVACGYVDVGEVAGKRYAVAEYAPTEQASMEAIRRFWRHGGDARLRDGRLVVVSAPFPLERLYQDAGMLHGIAVTFSRPEIFCADAPALVEGALAGSCGRVTFAVPANVCPAALARLGWRAADAPDGIALYVFDAACDAAAGNDARAYERIDLSRGWRRRGISATGTDTPS